MNIGEQYWIIVGLKGIGKTTTVQNIGHNIGPKNEIMAVNQRVHHITEGTKVAIRYDQTKPYIIDTPGLDVCHPDIVMDQIFNFTNGLSICGLLLYLTPDYSFTSMIMYDRFIKIFLRLIYGVDKPYLILLYRKNLEWDESTRCYLDAIIKNYHNDFIITTMGVDGISMITLPETKTSVMINSSGKLFSENLLLKDELKALKKEFEEQRIKMSNFEHRCKAEINTLKNHSDILSTELKKVEPFKEITDEIDDRKRWINNYNEICKKICDDLPLLESTVISVRKEVGNSYVKWFTSYGVLADELLSTAKLFISYNLNYGLCDFKGTTQERMERMLNKLKMTQSLKSKLIDHFQMLIDQLKSRHNNWKTHPDLLQIIFKMNNNVNIQTKYDDVWGINRDWRNILKERSYKQLRQYETSDDV